MIKFRAYDKEKTAFCPVVCIEWDSNQRISQVGMLHPTDDIPWQYSKAEFDERFVMLQWTGLWDKDGKEVYEGDMINIFETIYFEHNEILRGEYVVEFESGAFWVSGVPLAWYTMNTDTTKLNARVVNRTLSEDDEFCVDGGSDGKEEKQEEV